MKEVTLTATNFETEVIKSSLPVLVDFWAPWCGPCKMIAPVLEEIAEEFDGKLKVGKINVDDEGDLAREYGIKSIPTLMIFKDGELKDTSVGYKTKDAVADWIASYL